MAGIYIHIPFCKKACNYCNFHFSTSLALRKSFVQAVLKEIELQQSYLTEPVSTIYFGGGTPSLLPAGDIEAIINSLQKTFTLEREPEITLEANPDDITIEKLTEWKKLGINRLSIGIQSFFEEDLLWMNRAHNAMQAQLCIKHAQQLGFNNLTIDLIYGGPTLTDEHWQQNVQRAIELDVPHLSCYALTVEPRTALDNLIAANKVEPVDAEKQARHFELLMHWMQRAGYEHYEISNFAKPGFRSRHNSSYWQGRPYLGIGPSAHSFNGNERRWNISNNAIYIKQLQQHILPFEKEELTSTQKLNEYIMMSLRTAEGLSLNKVLKQFGKKQADKIRLAGEKYVSTQHLCINEDCLQLNNKGKLLADGIAADLFQL